MGGRVLLLGMQGSGKGTVARGLKRTFDAAYVGAGDLLRRHVDEGGKWAAEIASRINNGRGVSEEISYGLLEERLTQIEREELLVLDGYPRRARQILLLMRILGSVPDLALQLEVPRPIAVSRLMDRDTCERCDRPHGPGSPPRRKGICDDCGGALVRREDDLPEKIIRRHDTWGAESSEILAFFERAGCLCRIDATQPPWSVDDAVSAEIRRLRN